MLMMEERMEQLHFQEWLFHNHSPQRESYRPVLVAKRNYSTWALASLAALVCEVVARQCLLIYG